ncbi:hypothetical protein LEN26_015174 [Aphanomyces euteiches]|nr:hypothetical protein LEN26_015174 [Aphanomyces euteiches]
MAPNLFTPIQIGSVQLKNRILMAPLTRVRAGPSHVPNDLMKEYYAQRASAGLISMIAPNTSAFVGEPGVYSQLQLLKWKEITDAVHAKGGKIFMQIWHAGRAAHPDNNGGAPNVAPSAIAIDGEIRTLQSKKPHAVTHTLTVDEIKTIVQQYATAAKNCVQRTDQYGGSLENRSRFLAEVVEAVIAAIGADKLGIRVSPVNTKLAQRFSLAFVHILRYDILKIQEADIEPVFRKHFHNTLISNVEYSKDEANAAIEAGKLDAVAFGVPFIANPDLVERFVQNAPLNPADPSTFYTSGAKGYTDYPSLPSSLS